MAEKDVENVLLQYLNLTGWFAWKNCTTGYYNPIRRKFEKHKSMYAINGVSDIIAVKQGIVIFVEVKFGKNRQTSDQILFEKNITDKGGHYFVARSLETLQQGIISAQSKSFCPNCSKIIL